MHNIINSYTPTWWPLEQIPDVYFTYTGSNCPDISIKTLNHSWEDRDTCVIALPGVIKEEIKVYREGSEIKVEIDISQNPNKTYLEKIGITNHTWVLRWEMSEVDVKYSNGLLILKRERVKKEIEIQ